MWFNAHFSLRENQDVWVLSLHIVLETLDRFSHHTVIRTRRLLHRLTFLLLAARPQIFQEAIRVTPSARGGNEILTGRTLFVGCPFGARPVCSAESGAATFAFLVCSDPTDFSPSGTESAFRLPELTARFGGIVGTKYEVEGDLNERQSGGRIGRARVMTKL
jgi:hypothetical protein